MKKFFNLIYFTWCLPQTILGAIFYFLLRITGKCEKAIVYKSNTFLCYTNNACVSLGKFIFCYKYKTSDRVDTEAQTRMNDHEYGHVLQGFLLGPLYLLVIGLPSITWNALFEKYRQRNGISYYSFYTEKWADAWGKVRRNI